MPLHYGTVGDAIAVVLALCNASETSRRRGHGVSRAALACKCNYSSNSQLSAVVASLGG